MIHTREFCIAALCAERDKAALSGATEERGKKVAGSSRAPLRLS